MHFLADESCDFGVVRALRAAGHDVKAVAEVALGARYPATARLHLPRIVLDLVNTEQDRLVGSFAVVQPSRIRISRGPTDRT
jgi:predicted nucleic acid-binding OB-fold protein